MFQPVCPFLKWADGLLGRTHRPKPALPVCSLSLTHTRTRPRTHLSSRSQTLTPEVLPAWYSACPAGNSGTFPSPP